LIAALWVAGLAQWWLARVLRLGWVARLWSGLAAVVAGHLTVRMEMGFFGIFLSTAMGGLVFAPALAVARSAGRRNAVLLPIAMALTILGGNGYLQIGLIAMSPAFLLLIFDGGLRVRPVWRNYALAAALAALLTAPLLVPLARFWPNFTKDVDWNLDFTQPLRYFVLNFVINDFSVVAGSALERLPHAAYSMYTGWLPILLAIGCLGVARRRDRRSLLFLVACAMLVLLTATAATWRWLTPTFPGLKGIRYPSVIGGLAVPPMLGLAAYGLDGLFSANWPRLGLSLQASREQQGTTFSLRWVLLVPLVCSLRGGYAFSQRYLYVTETGDGVRSVLRALRTPTLQWVEPPFGEHFWVEPAVRMGLKLSPGVMRWRWKGRAAPEPYLEANYLGPPPGSYEVMVVDTMPIYRFTDNREYAFVQTSSDVVPCQASGEGGSIWVSCTTPKAGNLVVRENSWSGWYAWRDGRRVERLEGQWLSVEAPAGEHTYRFRYLPWDVPIGVILSLSGVGLAIWQWTRHPPAPVTPMGKRESEVEVSSDIGT